MDQYLPAPPLSRTNISLVLGEERLVEGGAGPRRSTATLCENGQLDGYIITSVLTASGGDMVVVEARQLLDDGMSHIQVGDGPPYRQTNVAIEVGTCLVEI